MNLIEAFGEKLSQGADHLPGVLGAIAIILIGWMVARMLRRAARSLAGASNRILGRLFPSGVFAGARMSPFVATLLAEIVFWGVIFLAMTVAVRVAGFLTLSEWLDRIAIYIPNLVVAFAILVCGYLLSIFVRQQLEPLVQDPLQEGQGNGLARFAQGAVIAAALTMTSDQLGIDVVLPVSLLIIGAAAIALTFGVSVALGARTYMSDLIGMRSMQGQLSPGLTIEVDGIRGEILELSASQVLLETEVGKVLIPGHLICERVTTILMPENGSEASHE